MPAASTAGTSQRGGNYSKHAPSEQTELFTRNVLPVVYWYSIGIVIPNPKHVPTELALGGSLSDRYQSAPNPKHVPTELALGGSLSDRYQSTPNPQNVPTELVSVACCLTAT